MDGLVVFFFSIKVSERENRPVDANGSAAVVAAMISAGASETKRKHHDEVEPFKDVKRVSDANRICYL